jgi:hypothetical protein
MLTHILRVMRFAEHTFHCIPDLGGILTLQVTQLSLGQFGPALPLGGRTVEIALFLFSIFALCLALVGLVASTILVLPELDAFERAPITLFVQHLPSRLLTCLGSVKQTTLVVKAFELGLERAHLEIPLLVVA